MMVKVIIIDPFKRKIYEKEIGQDNLQDMHGIVGGYIAAAGAFENGDILFVNDEGLLKDNQEFFKVSEINPDPLAGVGFIQGHDDDGAGKDAAIDHLELALKVEWGR
jgi:hypothetical protein